MLLNTQGPTAVGNMLSLLTGHPRSPIPPITNPVATDGQAGGLSGYQLPNNVPMPPVVSASPPPKQSLIGKVHDFLVNHLTPEAPQGYDGLLSQDEIQKAKPGILSSLLNSPHGMGRHYEDNLDHVLQIHQIASQVQEHQRLMDARQKMADLFPALPNETPEQMNHRVEGMYAYAVQHGDLEMAKAIESMGAATVRASRPYATKQYAPQKFVDPSGRVSWIEPGDPIPDGFRPYTPPRAVGNQRAVGLTPAPIRTVEQQLKEAREDLRRATSVKAPGLVASDEAQASFRNLQATIPQLRARVDSLSSVRDRMASDQQGGTPHRTTTNGPRDTVKSQDEYDHLHNDLGWSDSRIAGKYNIAPAIKRVR